MTYLNDYKDTLLSNLFRINVCPYCDEIHYQIQIKEFNKSFWYQCPTSSVIVFLNHNIIMESYVESGEWFHQLIFLEQDEKELSPHEIDMILTEHGINPDEVGRKIKTFVKYLLDKERIKHGY